MIKSRFITYLVPGSIAGVTMLAGGILTLPGAFADGNDTSVSTATVTVPVACTMVGTTSTAHTAEIPNGINSRSSSYYPNGIGSTTLKAYCNDNEGFAVYAVGYTGDTIGNTYLRDSNLGQTADIATGLATSGATSNWAMRMGVTSGTYTPIIARSSSDTERQSGDTDYSDWAAVPSAYARVAYRNSGTDIDNGNVSAEGASMTTTYAAYISPTQQSGNYVGKVKYTLVHPASEYPVFPQSTEAGCIRYYPNGGNVVGTMGCQPISSTDTSIMLLASNYSREGYGFAGWSTTYDYSDSTGYLGPQETITFTAGQYTGSNPGLSLYARWIKSAGNIQNWSGCSGMSIGAVTALKDQRDNNTYAVAKLADGNCWMIENLRLDNTNSDNSTGALAQGYGGQFVGLADPEKNWMNAEVIKNSLYSTDGSDNTVNIGSSTADQRIPRYDNVNNQASSANRPQYPTTNTAKNSTIGSSMYSYGNYYTWAATVADTTAISSGDHDTTSICPKGWRVPLGGNSTGSIEQGANDPDNRVLSYSYLDRKLGGNGSNQSSVEARVRWHKYPVNIVDAGHSLAGPTSGVGISSKYWTATVYAATQAYSFLLIEDTTVNPGTSYNSPKLNAWSVRCVVSGT